jgi:hypothetical protein
LGYKLESQGSSLKVTNIGEIFGPSVKTGGKPTDKEMLLCIHRSFAPR